MIKKILDRIFPLLITLTALSVSLSAAFYSISGLSKLFASVFSNQSISNFILY